jgi:uncharacterized protein YbaR (Trm112 family)
MGLPPDLLQILVCPLCRQPVEEEAAPPAREGEPAGSRLRCVNPECGLRYPVLGFPVMLIERADRSCPRCGRPREWANDALSCAPCGLSVPRKLAPG